MRLKYPTVPNTGLNPVLSTLSIPEWEHIKKLASCPKGTVVEAGEVVGARLRDRKFITSSGELTAAGRTALLSLSVFVEE